MTLRVIDKLGKFYLGEAKRCAEKQLYFASCILYGAALEALLLETCYLYPENLAATKPAQKRKITTTETEFLKFDLNDLINISFELGWFETVQLESGRKMHPQDMMKLVKEIRNLIHPGKWCKDYKNVSISEGHYKDVSTVISVIIKQLIGLPFSERQKGGLPGALKKIFDR